MGIVALDELLSVDGERGETITLGDTIPDANAGPVGAYEVEEMRQLLAQSINRMPEREDFGADPRRLRRSHAGGDRPGSWGNREPGCVRSTPKPCCSCVRRSPRRLGETDLTGQVINRQRLGWSVAILGYRLVVVVLATCAALLALSGLFPSSAGASGLSPTPTATPVVGGGTRCADAIEHGPPGRALS